ncbi:hypothetical protein FRB96_004719 [Tulasnella sp. 330]|nr:hypothetical protein FRB96_004719 [Tulasnella sp. 330]
MFMAVEIQKQRTFFQPGLNWDTIAKPEAPVIHNFEHNLESIFWVTLWFFARRVEPECSPCPWTCSLWWNSVFQGSLRASQEREDALTSGATLYHHLHNHLGVAHLPEPLRSKLVKRVVLTGAILFEGYRKREDRFDDPRTFCALYAAMEEMIQVSSGHLDPKLLPSAIFSQTGTKRKSNGPGGGRGIKRCRTNEDATFVPTKSDRGGGG